MGHNHTDTATSTVCRCNRSYGTETLHPLASVIGIGEDAPHKSVSLDCYAVCLADGLPHGGKCATCRCDYTDAAMLFATPGRTIEPWLAHGGRLLLFHPRLMECECLAKKMAGFRFFLYDESEALLLSRQERRQADRCLDYIDEELHWGVDDFSCALLCNKIELLLNYCQRWHCRQLTLRHDLSQETVSRLTRRLDDYLRQGRAATEGLPKARLVAEWAQHSAAYTDDMLRHETGYSTDEYVAMRRMEVAKQTLLATHDTCAELAARLGFPGAAQFARLFTMATGCTPDDYRLR